MDDSVRDRPGEVGEVGEPGEVDESAEPNAWQAPPLLVWALATFHTALLVALAVGVLFWAGVAGELLAGLDTWIGVVAYLYLWIVTWWSNRRWLDEVRPGLVVGSSSEAAVVVSAMKWGGLAGAFFFLPLLLVGIALVVGAGGLEAIPFLVIAGAIAVALSFAVGSIVGTVFALLDLSLLRASKSWLPDGARGGGDPGLVETD